MVHEFLARDYDYESPFPFYFLFSRGMFAQNYRCFAAANEAQLCGATRPSGGSVVGRGWENGAMFMGEGPRKDLDSDFKKDPCI